MLDESQNSTALSGMWPIYIDARSKAAVPADTHFTVNDMAGSSYEYLPKEHILLGGRTDQYRKMYTAAMDTIKENLLFRGMTDNGRNIMFIGDGRVVSTQKKPVVSYRMQHSKCYMGGMVGVASKVFDQLQDLSLARMLTEGCIWSYDVMPTGIMPETFYATACETLKKCKWDEIKWLTEVRGNYIDRTGPLSNNDTVAAGRAIARDKRYPPGMAMITQPSYRLRPEAIESVFVMYRITGDRELQDAAWRMFQNIVKYTMSEFGNAMLYDVRETETKLVRQIDSEESYWFSQTLKYFYLIFSDPNLVSLDDYVL